MNTVMSHRSHAAIVIALICLVCINVLVVPAHAAAAVTNGGLEQRAVNGGFVERVVLAGNRAYLAEGLGITVLDATTPTTLTPQARIPLAGMVSGIAPVGDLLAVTINRPSSVFNQEVSQLVVLDLRDLNAPVIKSTLDIASRLRVASATATTAYLTNASQIALVDLRNVARPVLLGALSIPGNIQAFTVVGGYAYVGLNSTKVFSVVDVRNAAAPTVVGSTTLDGAPDDVTVVDGRAYVVGGFGGFTILDVQNPTNPTLLGSYARSGNGMSIEVTGNLAYFASGSGQLEVVDVSAPAAPTLRGVVTMRDLGVDLALSSTHVWAALGRTGLVAIAIADPTTPTVIGTYSHLASIAALHVRGTIGIAAAMYNGVQIVDFANPTAPRVIGEVNPAGKAGAVSVDVVGTLAVVGDLDFGLSIIDITNPVAPVVKGSFDGIGGVLDVQVVGTVAYLASTSGFMTVDIQNPASPQLLRQIISGQARRVQVVGNLTYVTTLGMGLAIFNTENPANPQLQSMTQLVGSVEGLHVVGTRAYVTYNRGLGSAGYSPGLAILDVANPTAPSVLGTIALPVYAHDLTVVGDLAYVAVGTGVEVIDVSDPTMPRDRGGIGGFHGGRVIAKGSTLYVTAQDEGLIILNTHPEQVAASTQLTAAAGGRLTTHDDALTLAVTPASVASTSVMTLTPGLDPGVVPPGHGRVLRAFSLNGRDATGAALLTLAQPATLLIQMMENQPPEAATTLHLWMWNGQSWQDVPFSLNPGGTLLTAAVSQLTRYALTREANDLPAHVYLPLVKTTP